MHIKNINKTYLAIILFAAALLLLTIPVVRVINSNPAIPGNDHYSHINSQTVIFNFLSTYIPQTILSISFPLFLAIASLILFAKLALRKVNSQHQLYYALIILVITPLFIGLHLGLNNYQLILFLGLFFALLYDMKTKWFYVPLAVLYVLDPLLTLGITIAIIIIDSVEERGRDALVSAFFLIGILIASNFLSLPAISFEQVGFSANELFSFFNARYGYSLFLLVLGFGGLFFEKKRVIPLFILVISLFYEPLRILGITILAFYSAKTFYELQKREWTISFIGNLTLLLFVCILFFGSSTYLKETIQDKPYEAHVDALVYLQQNGVQAKILSSENLGDFITFMTGYETIYYDKYFSSQQYKFIDSEFKKNDIGYIFIDKSMLSGEIWNHDEEGLLFLLKYNDNFKKFYETEDIQIYYFAPWRE